jgi:hypothetical protein
MNNLIIKRSQIVESQFTGSPSVGKKYNFLEIPNLSRNNIILYGFEAFTDAQLSVTPNNNVVIPEADQVGVVVTLRDNNKREFVYQIPYYTLIRANNGGFIIMVKPRIINLTDCYVQIVSVGTITQNMVAAFNLYYSIVGEE